MSLGGRVPKAFAEVSAALPRRVQLAQIVWHQVAVLIEPLFTCANSQSTNGQLAAGPDRLILRLERRITMKKFALSSRSISTRGLAVLLAVGASHVASCVAIEEDENTETPAEPAGTVAVLSDDVGLLTPSTGAFRGGDLWIVNSQLTSLLTGAPPSLPFGLVSIPGSGGDISGAIDLPGDSFFPEGVASASDGTLYVGGLVQRQVLRISGNSSTPDSEPFVDSDTVHHGVFGLTVDTQHDLLWFCDSALGTGSELVGVELGTGREAVRHAIPEPNEQAPASICNDVIVDPSGDVWFTDSTFGRILRIQDEAVRSANSAEVWLRHELLAPPPSENPTAFGANGLELVDGMLVVSNSEAGALVVVDPASATPEDSIQKVSLTEDGAPLTLCTPDGLRVVPETSELIIMENGLCGARHGRILRATLTLE